MFKSFSLCHAPWNSAKAEQTSPLMPKEGPVDVAVGFLRRVPCAGPCMVYSAANHTGTAAQHRGLHGHFGTRGQILVRSFSPFFANRGFHFPNAHVRTGCPTSVGSVWKAGQRRIQTGSSLDGMFLRGLGIEQHGST